MNNDQPETLPPPAVLLQLMTGYWVSQSIYVAAKLGVADLLADGPRPIEALAAATQSHASTLHRVLRALASVGIFTGEEPFMGKWLDLHMLVLLGARERTATEYGTLFHAAGFELTRVIPTPAGPSVVEAVPV